MLIVDDAQHAAGFTPVVGEIGRQARGYPAEAPVGRQGDAPGIDELLLRIGGIVHQHAFHAEVGFEHLVFDVLPFGIDRHIAIRCDFVRDGAGRKQMQHIDVPHVGEILKEVQVAVFAEIAAFNDQLAIGAIEDIDFWQRRRVFQIFAHIAPDDAGPFLNGVPRMTDFIFHFAVGRLQRHIDAAAAAVECPAMVGAGQPFRLDLCIFKRGAAVRALRADQIDGTIPSAKGDQIFSQHPDGIRNVLQIF